MSNIGFTHQTISNGVTQASAGTMQTVFDALRKVVDKSFRTAGEELDADTVSGYGIGTITAAPDNNMNNLLTNGNFYSGAFTYSNSTVQIAPDFNGYQSIIEVYGYSSTFVKQVATRLVGSGETYVRFYIGGSWKGWFALWTSSNDGNGGQPPAPKGVTGAVASTSTPATIFTGLDQDVMYQVIVWIPGYAISQAYVYGVFFNGSSGVGIFSWTDLKASTNLTVSLSGANLQVAHNIGGSLTCYYQVSKLT